MNKRDPCEGCIDYVFAGEFRICGYLLRTGHRRPCPFGAGCTVKQTEGCDSVKNWDKASALKLWEEGKSDPEIADAVGVSVTTVWQWRNKEGLAANRKPGWPKNVNAPPVSEPLPELEAVGQPGGSGPEGTDLDVDGPEAPGGSWPPGPVELHVELCGGWARLRAPGWAQAAQLWRMLNVCVEALRAGDK